MSKAFYDEQSGRVIIRGLKVKPGQNDFKFKNFTGEETDRNAKGSRNFCVVISEEDAASLKESLDKAGLFLNIKEYNGEYYFKIIFGTKFPPEVSKKKIMPNGRVFRTIIEEENYDKLQNALIAECDISCTPTFLAKRNTWTCYLNKFNFVPLVDPIEAEDMAIDAAEAEYPTEDEVPFD